MKTYDVVVLGGGSAGEWVATTVARGGKSVALVEERLVGGECPYFACMPSKAMLYAAEVRHLIGTAHAAGAVSRPLALDDGRAAYRAAAARRHEVAGRLDDSHTVRALEGLGGAVYRGRGRVRRPGLLEVSGREIGWTDLVISVGTVFKIPEKGKRQPPLAGALSSAMALSAPGHGHPRHFVGCTSARVQAVRRRPPREMAQL